MISLIRPALVLLGMFSVLTGILYPAFVTGLAQLIFPAEANGSLIKEEGRVVGSELIGQPFDHPRYFWGRPSATAPSPYNGAASAGSNLGPANPALKEAVAARITTLHAADPTNAAGVPVDLVTSSGSGLDPHITPAAAYYQVGRIAAARGLTEARIRSLIAAHVEGRTFGVLGEPRVNVLLLNRELDRISNPGA